MSTPYPPPGGQQRPGPDGEPGPASWGQGGQTYGGNGGPGAPNQGYGPYGGPGGNPQGYGPGTGQQGYGPGQQAPGPAGPGHYGSGRQGPVPYGAGPQGTGQYGAGPQGPGQYGPSPYGPGRQSPGGGPSGPPGQQQAPKAPKAPRAPRKPVDLGRVLPLTLGALGVLGFIFGFLRGLTVGDDTLGTASTYSVYQLQGHVPILVVIVGLFGVAPLLPGGKKYLLPTALLSVATLLAAISAVTSGVNASGPANSRGAGLLLVLFVALLQAAVALYVWLTDSGSVKPAGGRSRASSTGSGSPASSPLSGSLLTAQGRDPGAHVPGGSGASQPQPAAESSQYRSSQPAAYQPTAYQPAAYRPAGAPADAYGSHPPAGSDSADLPYRPGAADSSDPYGGQPGRDPGEAGRGQESTDQPRQGDEPPPDVTQQVRF